MHTEKVENTKMKVNSESLCQLQRNVFLYLKSVCDVEYSETSIYRSRIIRFPGSVTQFQWSLSESYFNYGSHIYCFPGSLLLFQTPDENDE
jgi:hypothetical protein